MDQTIITRKEAIAQGLNRYFTGKPCKHGHVTVRHITTGGCLECLRVNKQAYDQTEKGKAANRENQRRYQKTEKGRQCDKRKYQRKPERSLPAIISIKYPNAVIPVTNQEQRRIACVYKAAQVLRERTGQRWDVDQCYPLSLGGVHHPDNLMVLPECLNRQKHSKADPASPSVFTGFLLSFPSIAKAQGQKMQAGRQGLMIGNVK